MKRPLFNDPRQLLEFLGKQRAAEEAPWERRLRLALRYCPGAMARSTCAIEIGQAFAEKVPGLPAHLSNRQGGRKRRNRKELKFTAWYQRT